MISVKKRILVFVFSSFFFLALLELALRIAGYIYFSARAIPGGAFAAGKKSDYTILCLGDSFTFGGNVKADDSYPFYLKKLLDSNYPYQRIKVINGGVCEYNSAQVLRNLKRNIGRYRPDLIILLVGSSNSFNFTGLNHHDSFYSHLKDAFYSMRVYKMIRIAALNLYKKISLLSLRNGIKEGEDLLNESLLKTINPDYNILHEVADVNSDLVYYFERSGREHEASNLFKKSFSFRNNELSEYQFSDYCEEVFSNPLQIKLHSFQAPTDPESIFKSFLNEIEKNPNLAKNQLFMERLSFFESLKERYSREKIESRLREDLDKIVSICAQNNLKLIMQDYPHPYPMADRVLSDAAVKHSLPFVKNAKLFSSLLTENKKEVFFDGDTHCTSLGYKIMAENVYKVLKSGNSPEGKTGGNSEEKTAGK